MAEEGDEQLLVRAARSGDALAWEKLYMRVYPRLSAYLGRKVGFQHCEDAVSETMARAVAGIDRMAVGPAGFDGWVFGIARRVAADHHRKAGRHRRQDTAASIAGGREIDHVDGSDAVVTHDDYDEIRRMFDRLSSDEQEVLELRVIAGLSAEQVAAVIGKKPGAVRTSQSRALSHLKELLKQQYPTVESRHA